MAYRTFFSISGVPITVKEWLKSIGITKPRGRFHVVLEPVIERTRLYYSCDHTFSHYGSILHAEIDHPLTFPYVFPCKCGAPMVYTPVASLRELQRLNGSTDTWRVVADFEQWAAIKEKLGNGE